MEIILTRTPPLKPAMLPLSFSRSLARCCAGPGIPVNPAACNVLAPAHGGFAHGASSPRSAAARGACARPLRLPNQPQTAASRRHAEAPIVGRGCPRPAPIHVPGRRRGSIRYARQLSADILGENYWPEKPSAGDFGCFLERLFGCLISNLFWVQMNTRNRQIARSKRLPVRCLPSFWPASKQLRQPR
jgi:hypothetical protein